jgi:hypothetical protein
MDIGPSFLGSLAALAAAYCIWIWFSRAESRPSWVGFLATATGFLFLVTLPVVVAIYLPVLNPLNSLPAN